MLAQNSELWLEEYLADKQNATKRYRYRHPDVKSALREESGHKCVYCESKLGHNTPGDVEHKTPTSQNEALHFTWTNLALACTECNRRKNKYYSEALPFLDPHVDDVEAMLMHLGPIVTWQPGTPRSEVTIKTLELNSDARLQLVLRKLEKIEEVMNLLERHISAGEEILKGLLKKQLLEMQNKSSEYSAMVKTMLVGKLQ